MEKTKRYCYLYFRKDKKILLTLDRGIVWSCNFKNYHGIDVWTDRKGVFYLKPANIGKKIPSILSTKSSRSLAFEFAKHIKLLFPQYAEHLPEKKLPKTAVSLFYWLHKEGNKKNIPFRFIPFRYERAIF